MFWSVVNYAIWVTGFVCAIWVWRDGHRRRDPWAPTWALGTAVAPVLALPAYLLHRWGRNSPA